MSKTTPLGSPEPNSWTPIKLQGCQKKAEVLDGNRPALCADSTPRKTKRPTLGSCCIPESRKKTAPSAAGKSLQRFSSTSKSVRSILCSKQGTWSHSHYHEEREVPTERYIHPLVTKNRALAWWKPRRRRFATRPNNMWGKSYYSTTRPFCKGRYPCNLPSRNFWNWLSSFYHLSDRLPCQVANQPDIVLWKKTNSPFNKEHGNPGNHRCSKEPELHLNHNQPQFLLPRSFLHPEDF